MLQLLGPPKGGPNNQLEQHLGTGRELEHAMTPSRRPDTGLQRPMRPLPDDFRAVFLRLGQTREIEEHYRTNWRVIRRWIEEAGGDELREERARVSGGFVRPRQRSSVARSYVLGQRLRVMTKPTFFDAELMEDGK